MCCIHVFQICMGQIGSSLCCLKLSRFGFPIVCFMAFLKKGKDRRVVFDFVSAWVSDRSNLGNLELDCMDASLDVGGAHRGATYFDHQIEGDDDKVAWISKVCMVNSEVCHGMELCDFGILNEKAVYKKRVGASRRWRKEIFKAKPQI